MEIQDTGNLLTDKELQPNTEHHAMAVREETGPNQEFDSTSKQSQGAARSIESAESLTVSGPKAPQCLNK